MNVCGIYTLANDTVWDQLVALLNSVEVNVSPDIPVCIIPYNKDIKKVKEEIKNRANVSLFDDWDSIERWENFAHQVWSAHTRAKKSRLSRPRWYKSHLQRKFVVFDGIFEQFIFYEADNLAMKSVDDIWEKLKDYDFVFDDWEHNKPTPVAALNIPLIESSTSYREADIRPKIHDASFFASKKGFFNQQKLLEMQEKLIKNQEVEWINQHGWWDDVYLFNYMTFRSDRPLYNFTLSQDSKDRTGNCADADLFVNIDNVLYNKEGLKPIHRIHYMNYSSAAFTNLCQGEKTNIRYQEEFLYYRFLKEPEKRPKVFKSPNMLAKINRKWQKLAKKIKITLS